MPFKKIRGVAPYEGVTAATLQAVRAKQRQGGLVCTVTACIWKIHNADAPRRVNSIPEFGGVELQLNFNHFTWCGGGCLMHGREVSNTVFYTARVIMSVDMAMPWGKANTA